MLLAIEMFLDDRADAAVRSLWRELVRDGLPALDDAKHRPHVSLAVLDGSSVEELLALLGEWAPRQQDVALRLSHIGRFPESGVAFLGVTPTRSLIDVHTDLHVRVATLASGTAWSLYQPGVWVPHCTLAMHVPDAAVSHLLSLAHAVKLPIEAAVVEVGLVEIESGKVLERFALARTERMGL